MNLDKYSNILKFRKISGIVISLTSLVTTIVILFTIYGNQVGNFVISVSDVNRYNIALSEDYSFSKSFSRLSAKGINEMDEATYADIPENIGESIGGSHNDNLNRYLAYTFYLKNMSNVYIEYKAALTIEKSTKNIEHAIRFLVVKDSISNIYAMPKVIDGDINNIDWINRPPETHLDDFDEWGKRVQKKYTTTAFLSPVTVFEEEKVGMEIGAIYKYTVVIWIEGMDAQSSESIKGGILKTNLQFSVLN